MARLWNGLVMKDKKFFLASYARSGNTLTRLLLEHHFNINAQSSNPSRRARIKGYFRGSTRKDLQSLETVRPNAQGTACKTHELLSHDIPALVLVRDGRDAMVSYAHYNQDIEHSCKSFEELLKLKVQSSKWTKTYQWWLHSQRADKPFTLIKYEEILKELRQGNVVQYLQRALHKLDLNFEPVTLKPLDPFNTYHKENPKFFRRGVAGSWKDEMAPEIEEDFWKIHGPTMKWLGYER